MDLSTSADFPDTPTGVLRAQAAFLRESANDTDKRASDYEVRASKSRRSAEAARAAAAKFEAAAGRLEAAEAVDEQLGTAETQQERNCGYPMMFSVVVAESCAAGTAFDPEARNRCAQGGRG